MCRHQQSLMEETIAVLGQSYDLLVDMVLPAGGELTCTVCLSRKSFRSGDAKTWFRDGWPTCCDVRMHLELIGGADTQVAQVKSDVPAAG